MRTILFVAFALLVLGANWAIDTFGLITVWPGLLAPAGVLFAGATLGVRDLLHDFGGRRWVVAAIAAGAALSFLTAPSFALASAVAFSLSEFVDFAIYTPLRERSRLTGLLLSNTVGAILDSVVFLWLAFGSLAFLEGQVVGKVLVTVAFVPFFIAIKPHSRLHFAAKGG